MNGTRVYEDKKWEPEAARIERLQNRQVRLTSIDDFTGLVPEWHVVLLQDSVEQEEREETYERGAMCAVFELLDGDMAYFYEVDKENSEAIRARRIKVSDIEFAASGKIVFPEGKSEEMVFASDTHGIEYIERRRVLEKLNLMPFDERF